MDLLKEKFMDENMAKFLLRFAVGFLMLFHGVAKVIGGVGFIEGLFVQMGLPGFFAYGAYLGEIVAPIMLLIGYQVRLASLLIIATMLFAIFMVHAGDIFALTAHGAWAIELLVFYILAALAIFFQGAGSYRIGKKEA